MARSGIAVGLNAGHVVTPAPAVSRPSHTKGKLNKRVAFVRDVVREVTGFAPFERRVMELLKVGKDKRAMKMCKKRLGTMLRGKRKREELTNLMRKKK